MRSLFVKNLVCCGPSGAMLRIVPYPTQPTASFPPVEVTGFHIHDKLGSHTYPPGVSMIIPLPALFSSVLSLCFMQAAQSHRPLLTVHLLFYYRSMLFCRHIRRRHLDNATNFPTSQHVPTSRLNYLLVHIQIVVHLRALPCTDRPVAFLMAVSASITDHSRLYVLVDEVSCSDQIR